MVDSLKLLVDLDASGLERKISSIVTSITGAFNKFEKLNFNDLLKGMDNINWTSVVGKLFSPANLIAFFSAMAATGIIASIQQQAAGSAAAGGTGTIPPGGPTVYGQQAQSIAGTIGTLAGGVSDIGSTIAQVYEYIKQYGGSLQDAVNITQVLGEALTTTGGNFAEATGPILTMIKEAGATNITDITNMIGAIEEASQAAGGAGQGASMANIASGMQKFTTEAVKANTSVQGIISSVQALGAMAAVIGFPLAMTELNEMGTLLDSNVDREILGLPDLAKVINTQGAIAAFDLMNGRIKTIAPTLDPAIYAQLGLNNDILDAVAAYEKGKSAIDANFIAIQSLGPPTENIAKQFALYDNVILEGSKALSLMEGIFADWVNSPMLTLLLAAFDGVLQLIKDISDWLNKGGLLSSVATGSVLGALVSILPALAGAAGTVLGKIGGIFSSAEGAVSTVIGDVDGAAKSVITDITGGGTSSGIVGASGEPISSGVASEAGGLSAGGVGAVLGALYNFLVPAQYGGGVQSAGGDLPAGKSVNGTTTILVKPAPGTQAKIVSPNSQMQNNVSGVGSNSGTPSSTNISVIPAVWTNGMPTYGY